MANAMPQELGWLIKADRVLKEAHTVQDFKSIRDKAKEAQAILKLRDLPRSLRIDAAEIRVTAARCLGQAIASLHLSHGGRPRRKTAKDTSKNRSPAVTSLHKLGIAKNLSCYCQRLALIPPQEFDQYLKECREAGCEVTRGGLLQLEEWLRAGGAASGLPRPRGGQRGRRVAKPRSASEGRNASASNHLQDAAYEPLDSITIDGHREQLQEFLSKLLRGKPLVPQDVATLLFISRICYELIKDLQHQSLRAQNRQK
jgi:hypothetical protein